MGEVEKRNVEGGVEYIIYRRNFDGEWEDFEDFKSRVFTKAYEILSKEEPYIEGGAVKGSNFWEWEIYYNKGRNRGYVRTITVTLYSGFAVIFISDKEVAKENTKKYYEELEK